MEKSGFFNANLVNEAYDREYLAQDFAEYFSSFIGNGVFPDPSTGLQVISQEGRNIVLSAGEAWINGYWYRNTSQRQFVITPADGVLNRIDAIVIQLNYSNRSIVSKVMRGSPANVPEKYLPIRNSDIYELIVSYVYVGKGTVSILQSDITDTRLNNSLCGIVHGLIQQIDTTTIFNQFQAYYNAKVAEWNNQMSSQQSLWSTQTSQQQNTWQNQLQDQQLIFSARQNTLEAQFMEWWNKIKTIMSGDPIGNILILVEGLRTDLNAHTQNTEVHVSVQDKQRWNSVTLDASVAYLNNIYTLTLVAPPQVLPEIISVRFVAPKTYVIGEKFKIGVKEFVAKNGYFELGDVVSAEFHGGLAYFSAASIVPSNRGLVDLSVTSYNGLNLNRVISYKKGSEATQTIQLDDTGKAVLDLVPDTYTFGVVSVPSGYKKPPDKQISVAGGKRTAAVFSMDYSAVDSDKTLIIVDVSTFDGKNKENLSVDIGGTVVRTDINGRAQRLAPAYSSGTTLAKYTISVVAPKGYKTPDPVQVTAIAGDELPVSVFLAKYAYAVYGLRIPENDANPASPVYTDDAIGMTKGSALWDSMKIFNTIRPCVVSNPSGVVNYYLNPNDYTKKLDDTPADITSGNDGDVMIEIPKFAAMIYREGTDLIVKITDNPNAKSFDTRYGYNAFSWDSEGDANTIYVGAYLGYGLSGKIRSLSNKTPTASQTIGVNISKCAANGTGYVLMPFYVTTMLQCLYLIKYGSLNSQDAVGIGWTNKSAVTATGGANSRGMYYGDTSGNQMKLFGIEDFWGNLRYWIGGLYCDSGYNILTAYKNFNDSGSGYRNVGHSGATSNTGGWVSKPQGGTSTGFIPSAYSGSGTTYYADYGFLYASCLPDFGGVLSDGASAGAFRLYVSRSAANAFSDVGARLCFIKK